LETEERTSPGEDFSADEVVLEAKRSRKAVIPEEIRINGTFILLTYSDWRGIERRMVFRPTICPVAAFRCIVHKGCGEPSGQGG
jgi:hypothetical protein